MLTVYRSALELRRSHSKDGGIVMLRFRESCVNAFCETETAAPEQKQTRSSNPRVITLFEHPFDPVLMCQIKSDDIAVDTSVLHGVVLLGFLSELQLISASEYDAVNQREE
jgi:hypothetical protein